MKHFAKALCLAAGLALGGAFCLSAAAAYQTEAYIPVEVRLENASSGGEFRVRLQEVEDVPLPVETGLIFPGPGKKSFGPIEYRRPVTAGYLVSQQAGTEPGITYDNTLFGVLVFVENDAEDGLQASVVSFRMPAGWQQEPLTMERFLEAAQNAEKSEIIFTNRGETDPGPGPETPSDPEPEPEETQPQTVKAALPLIHGPKTGDAALPGLWAGLFMAALLALGLLSRARGRNH